MNDAEAPRFSRVRAALTVAVALTATGAAVGALWAWLAPPVHGVVALARDGERVRAHLGNESDHFFVAAFLLVGMLCVVGAVAAVAVWQWRAHRGPVMTAALATGCMLAAGVAAGVGALLVHLRYGTIDVAAAPVTPEHRVHYVTEAPPVFFGPSPLQAALTILFPAAVAALVYSLAAVSTARDDLGAWPPVEVPAFVPPPATADVTAESAPPSGPSSP
ncbi:hypothetical protein AU184_05990 [Mycolicibacterium novocastrense]|uniref:DUF2567 domain-containing protein n=1 Tax=Mycolicibacterium novocastrense TaxID=59813 RepID=UPI000746650F|nr:DUF2567 domain-containing protein [Mycolicibacterium novocastrense]KUH65674.1 hypothetical protein AU072_06455 [Mycolicibacterium novocastrense]KUH65906.1 hypothetical protein AU183_14870 [Mycolicibacterium novocastrense]KUH67113.1 hypothetical protein AU184_05990 [Mycolicibacterium novocastrense]